MAPNKLSADVSLLDDDEEENVDQDSRKDDAEKGDEENDVDADEEKEDSDADENKEEEDVADEKKEEDNDDDDEDDDEDIVIRKRKVVHNSDEEKEDEDDSEDEDDDIVTKKTKVVHQSDEDKVDDDDEDDEEDIVIRKRKVVHKSDEEKDDEDGSEEDSDSDSDSDGGVDTEAAKEEGEKSEEAKGGEEEEGDEDEEEDEEQVIDRPSQNETLYDFDIMMAKKKEENSKRRKRKNYDIINDNDDIIADIINQMKDAVEADSEANKNKMAATRKLKLLPFVISQLRKVDLRDAFLDSDVLSVITEWLAPLPDRSLPHLNIRENLIKILIDFNLYDVDRIKSSGIGKAIMYLYKHPKETRENKQRAKQLISSWSRPIFQLDSSFTAISREEREQRDLELMSKQRRASKHNDSSDGEEPGPSAGPKRAKDDPGPQKPGEKGWIPRARVPAPSMKDYVIRPRSKVDGDIGKNSKRPSNMLEKYMKNQQDRRRANRQQRAINMKIDRV